MLLVALYFFFPFTIRAGYRKDSDLNWHKAPAKLACFYMGQILTTFADRHPLFRHRANALKEYHYTTAP